MQSTSKSFLRGTVQRLRSLPHFVTEVRVEDELDPEDRGVARLRGYVVRPSRAGWLSHVALWAVFVGSVLCMFDPPALDHRTNEVANRVGYGVLLGGAGCLAVAEVDRRRNRTPTLVEIRAAQAPVTGEALVALRRDATPGQAWLVSEASLSEDASAVMQVEDVTLMLEGPEDLV